MNVFVMLKSYFECCACQYFGVVERFLLLHVLVDKFAVWKIFLRPCRPVFGHCLSALLRWRLASRSSGPNGRIARRRGRVSGVCWSSRSASVQWNCSADIGEEVFSSLEIRSASKAVTSTEAMFLASTDTWRRSDCQ